MCSSHIYTHTSLIPTLLQHFVYMLCPVVLVYLHTQQRKIMTMVQKNQNYHHHSILGKQQRTTTTNLLLYVIPLDVLGLDIVSTKLSSRDAIALSGTCKYLYFVTKEHQKRPLYDEFKCVLIPQHRHSNKNLKSIAMNWGNLNNVHLKWIMPPRFDPLSAIEFVDTSCLYSIVIKCNMMLKDVHLSTFKSLHKLCLYNCPFITNINLLQNQLYTLRIVGCANFQKNIEHFTLLKRLYVKDCNRLEIVENNLALRVVDINNCDRIKRIQNCPAVTRLSVQCCAHFETVVNCISPNQRINLLCFYKCPLLKDLVVLKNVSLIKSFYCIELSSLSLSTLLENLSDDSVHNLFILRCSQINHIGKLHMKARHVSFNHHLSCFCPSICY